jgi:hypothetical protein
MLSADARPTHPPAMSRGKLPAAQRSLQEAIAHLENGGGGPMIKTFARSWLAAVTGMTGRTVDARRELSAVERSPQDAEAGAWDLERFIAGAWTYTAEGATSQAISILREAAANESECGRAAWEVMLLQTATQIGDHTTGARLAELAGHVQGPRTPAAAAHAAALAAGNGDALLDASRQYEAFGDRIAAADAAAHAVVAYQNAGLRGAASSASATSQRLAAECNGAQTPALRAATTWQPFTARHREIISLAAQGLSKQGGRGPADHVDPLRRRTPLPRLPTRRSQQPRTADLHSARMQSHILAAGEISIVFQDDGDQVLRDGDMQVQGAEDLRGRQRGHERTDRALAEALI